MKEQSKKTLGCGKKVYDKSNRKTDDAIIYICGQENAWGEWNLCKECKKKNGIC